MTAKFFTFLQPMLVLSVLMFEGCDAPKPASHLDQVATSDAIPRQGFVCLAVCPEDMGEGCDNLKAALQSVAKGYPAGLKVLVTKSHLGSPLTKEYDLARLPALLLIENGQTIAATTDLSDLESAVYWLDGTYIEHRTKQLEKETETLTVLNGENFEEIVFQNEQPVLVDFWAAWCGPCSRIAPSVRWLSLEYQGKLVVGKLNVDESRDLASQYVQEGIPLLVVFHKGRVLDSLVGAYPAGVIGQWVADTLQNIPKSPDEPPDPREPAN